MPAETTGEMSPPSTADTEVQVAPVVLAIAADSCASCGVHLASDQRYCVECGHPRGAARLPVATVADPGAEAPPTGGSSPAGPPSGLWRTSAWRSPNATLLAVVGSLLLALGIGVLVGRSDGGAPSAGGSQRVVTVVLSGSGAATGAVVPAPVVTAGATGATGATASSIAAPSVKKAAAKPVSAKTAPPKAVKIGSSGSGPGYQAGKFTGNFFGGG